MSEPLLTVAIPTYNSIGKMTETIRSLDDTAALFDCKILFVDDCSTDDTYESLQELAVERPHWKVFRLDRNSGTAARPRNWALDHVETPYVFFLDSDDVLVPEGIQIALNWASKKNADLVRSSLIVRRGDGTENLGDLIPGWDKITGIGGKIRAITKHQSLTCSSIFRVSMLRDNNVRFDEQRRIGEDIVFTAKALCAARSVEYRSAPARKYIRTSAGNESITQKISSTQFADFVRSWNDVEDLLETRNVSFVTEHGFAAIAYAIRQFIWFGSEIVEREDFELFHEYCLRHKQIIQTFPFKQRLKDVIDNALAGDYEGFLASIRLRLLIAGHDLKFLKDIIPLLEKTFNVRIDKWTTNNSHDETQSQELLKWADLVWAEWMLGAAKWYSEKVDNTQRLVVRAHRTEMTSPIALEVNARNVDAFVAIAPHTLGDFADRFDIPRDKFYLIPNAFDIESYRRGSKEEGRSRKIGMVGILPKLKRFDLAIDLLAMLREHDSDFELHVFGKKPEELDWLMRIEEESEYYEECSDRIKELGLQNSIVYRGWVDLKTELSNLGALVSMSDYEGMQVALGEAYCAEILGVSLPWRGIHACYPEQFVFENVDQMAEYLLEILDDHEKYREATAVGRRFMEQHYALTGIHSQILDMIRAVRA